MTILILIGMVCIIGISFLGGYIFGINQTVQDYEREGRNLR